jgi:DNA-directed RNA polymerase subunit beta'
MDDAIMAFEQGLVDLHAKVWLRFDGPVETEQKEEVLEEEIKGDDGTVTRLYKQRRVREDAEGNLVSQYIETTPGRIIYNKTIHGALAQ